MDQAKRSLRIVHVLRAPVGGLFRHVTDLARDQAARGHKVGIVAASNIGGEDGARQLARLAPSLELGVSRFAMRREPHPGDLVAIIRLYGEMLRLRPDVLHGHGSKGGFYARSLGYLPLRPCPLRVYTPHGGSFHPQPGHRLFLRVEKFIASKTDLLLFESDYIAQQFAEGVGKTGALQFVAKNGLRPEEFQPVELAPDAVDFVYVGELSRYKGVDTLIEALALIHADGVFAPKLVIVGSGGEFESLANLVDKFRLNHHIAFYGVLPARDAFTLGKIVVTPSRAESLPYVVLEAIAAQKSIIAANVGGIPEIFGPCRDRLVPHDHAPALAAAMTAMLGKSDLELETERQMLLAHVARNFKIAAMVDKVMAGYEAGLARRSRIDR